MAQSKKTWRTSFSSAGGPPPPPGHFCLAWKDGGEKEDMKEEVNAPKEEDRLEVEVGVEEDIVSSLVPNLAGPPSKGVDHCAGSGDG